MSTPTGDDEAALWRRSLTGDGGAFGAVFDLHRDRVHRHACRLLDTVADAEDATASAFLELWRRRDDVRLVDGSVLPWLLVTTTNVTRNLTRSRRRYRDFLARLPRASTSPDTADVVLDHGSVGLDPAMTAALRALGARDLELVTLVVLEDLSLGDAALALGISASAAKARMHRARGRLREQLGDTVLDPTAPAGGTA
jgi:RNA polymerase sigma factor (sigma-70 family)